MPPGVAAAYTDTLDGEYAAIFAYGTAGAAMTGPARESATTFIDDHRRARDWLRTAMITNGLTPPPPAAAYTTGDIADEAAAIALTAQVELALVPRWAALGGVVTDGDRAYCAQQSQSSATRAVRWGAPSAAFPGTTAPSVAPSSEGPTASSVTP